MYVLWDVIGEHTPCVPIDLTYGGNILDDTIRRRTHTSDAAAFAKLCRCCPSQGSKCFNWYHILRFPIKLLSSVGCYMAHSGSYLLRSGYHSRAGSLQSKFPVNSSPSQPIYPSQQQSAAEQRADSSHFLPVPGSSSGALSIYPSAPAVTLLALGLGAFGLL